MLKLRVEGLVDGLKKVGRGLVVDLVVWWLKFGRRFSSRFD